MFTTIITFIVVLAVLILVHELGHFWAAKKAGCTVEEFGIGFPPRLFAFKRGDTVYSVNIFPVGGFVKIKGENGDDAPDEKSFVAKSFGWKSLIISAGVLMNVALAYVLISSNLLFGVPVIVDGQDFGASARLQNTKVAVIEVLPDSPAHKAGIAVGDAIVGINDTPMETVGQTIQRIADTGTDPMRIAVSRNGETEIFTVAAESIPELSRVALGVGLAETADLSYPWYTAWWYGLQRTLLTLWLIVQAFAVMIASLFRNGSPGADVAGPIGIAVLTGEVARLGWAHLVQFTALLSLNLAVINILPLPALDGGRLALIVMERLRGKKIRVNIEQWIHVVGFAFLIVLMVAVTARDLGKYGQGIWHAITQLFT